MSTIRIAVIDSGVHATHPHIREVVQGVGFDADGSEVKDCVDRLGHGTAVAAAIQDLSPSVALVPVKVFADSLTTSVRALVAAIGWSADQGAALINLSLGVGDPDHADSMRVAVEAAGTKGAVIVAAGEHDGVRWLPGTLDNVSVLRVELDWACPRGSFTCHNSGRTPIFRTSGYPRPIPGVAPTRNLKGLSFAVANMTGLAAQALVETGADGYQGLVNELIGRAERSHSR